MIFYESKSNPLYCWYGSDMTFPPHIHKEIEIVMLTKGAMEMTTNSGTYTLEPGDISFALPNTIHGYKTHSHNDFFIMIFNIDMLPLHKNTFTVYRASEPFIPGSLVPGEVYSCLDAIYQEFQKDNSLGIITGYLYIAVSRLLPFLNLQKNQKDFSGDLIERTLGYIQLNYLNPINLSTIAGELKVSPFYLSRIFSSSLGLRLDKYINELRINYANHLLANSNKQVTEIAFECGFETLRTFNRVYKNITAITPREFRKQQ